MARRTPQLAACLGAQVFSRQQQAPLDGRRSLPPAAGPEGLSASLVASLVDRLTVVDDPHFALDWLERAHAQRGRIEPPLSLRLLRLLRQAGRMDHARSLAAQVRPSSPAWSADDLRQFAVERALLLAHGGALDQAETELRQLSSTMARGGPVREQFDLQRLTAFLHLARGRHSDGADAFRAADSLLDRMGDQASPSDLHALGLGFVTVGNAQGAIRALARACQRLPATTLGGVEAALSLALCYASVGSIQEARVAARDALSVARELGALATVVDALDTLALTELSADQPGTALSLLDEAATAGVVMSQTSTLQMALHRQWALCMLGRGELAAKWMPRIEKLRDETSDMTQSDELEYRATQAFLFETTGELDRARVICEEFLDTDPVVFEASLLHFLYARVVLKQRGPLDAMDAVRFACLSGDAHGWVYPSYSRSGELFSCALGSGDSRAVRYAEAMLRRMDQSSEASLPPLSSRMSVADFGPPSVRYEVRTEPPETLVYFTSIQGVSRTSLSEAEELSASSDVCVNVISHTLRVGSREVSLERRRALEPLLIQFFRRAREGLAPEDVLRAAGGPGLESADAEHRVRVLISRVRDLLGDPSTIERVREAGEKRRTRYRLSPQMAFALIEPLQLG